MTRDDLLFSVELVENHFDASKPRRLIAGVALSTDRKNFKGDAFQARGVVPAQLPMPLLLEHNYLMPIGLVRELEVRGTQLHFRGEVANTDRMEWARQAWEKIATGESTGVSVRARDLGGAYGRTIPSWELFELSLVGVPADYRARIESVSIKEPVVYLDRPSHRLLWRALKVAS